MQNSATSEQKFHISLAAVVFAGAILRLWNLSSQPLLDDEWHALNFVMEKSFWEVLFLHGLGANSIPVNIYSWLTIHTVGWSEHILRFPSIFSGILALVMLPILARRLWGGQVALIAAVLMSVSPILIFYSRVARPYGPVMLLAPLSLLLTMVWIKEGKRRYLILAASFGSIAVWYHLYATIPVILPFAVAALLPTVTKKLGNQFSSQQPLRDILLASKIMVSIILPFVVLPNILFPWWLRAQGKGHATPDTIVTVARYLAGSHLITLGLLAIVLVILGLLLMVKRLHLMGFAYVVPFIFFVCAMAITTQDGAQAGIQAARYGIAFFPLAFITMAFAISEAGKWIDITLPVLFRGYSTIIIAVAFIVPSIATSPLWRTYSHPNNFTGHSAFQYRYEQLDWSKNSPRRDLFPTFSMKSSDISRFYLYTNELNRYKGVVEYPMILGDHFNLLYYFQRVHRLPVAAGYISSICFEPENSFRGCIFPEDTVDFVMGSISDKLKKSIKWRSMIDLNDKEALIQNYKDWLIVVHLKPYKYFVGCNAPNMDYMDSLVIDLKNTYGAPVYEDQQLLAWHIR